MKSQFLFVCVKGKSEAEIQTDTDDFLPPLRRLSPPPPANSHAKTACSDTLTEAGYARCGDENQPTVLSWILLSDLPILRDGTACHACIQSLKHFVACADFQLAESLLFKSNACETWCVILVSES